MLYAIVSPPKLPEGWVHEATDYEVANDVLFKDIVLESTYNTGNKLVKVFTEDLDPNKVYYARARIIFNKAIGEWTDIQLIHPRDIDKLNLSIEMPGLVASPTISVTGTNGNMPNSLFTITTSEFKTNSSASHSYSNYLIVDMSGKTVFSSLNDTDNLTSLFVDSVALEDGHSYIIFVSHASSSNDISDMNGILVTIPEVKDIQVTSKTYGIDKDTDLTFSIEVKPNVVEVTYNLYLAEVTEAKTLVSSQATNTFEVVFDKSLLVSESEYYIMEVVIKDTNNKVSSKHIPLVFDRSDKHVE